MGKGGGPSYVPPNPADQTRAAIEQERIRQQYQDQRDARIQAQQRAAEAQKAAEAAAAQRTFSRELDLAMRAFQSDAREQLNRRGLTGSLRSEFIPLIDREARQLRSRAPTSGSNASQFFDVDSVLNRLVQEQTGYKRTGINRELDSFLGAGFDKGLISDTADDAYINDIINSRYNDAYNMVDRSYKRGNLNDSGLAAAMAALGEQRSSANARLQDIGGGLLETGRESLRTIGSNARDRANAFTLGGSFDTGAIRNDLFSERDSFLGGLRGQLDNAIGGDPLFDINNIIFRGGVGQGAQNATGNSPALLTALAGDQERKNKTIGLGNTGAF